MPTLGTASPLADAKTKQLKLATNSFNKGWTLSLREEHEQALDAFFETLEIRELWLGKLHADTGKTYYQIAITLQQSHQLEEALIYFRRAYQTWESCFGKDHSNTSDAEAGIKGILEEQGMDFQSIEDYVDGFGSAIQRGKSGDIYYARGDFLQAQWDFQMQLTLQESAIGKFHPDTADIYCKIASVQNEIGDYDCAVETYQTAAMIYQASLGDIHPTLANVYIKIAEIHLNNDAGNKEVARYLYQNALSIYTATRGCCHPDTLGAYTEVQKLKQQAIENKPSGNANSRTADTVVCPELEDSLLCPCCQVNLFSADPSNECAPIMGDSCGHSICRSCVRQSSNTSCPLCKAQKSFPRSAKVQRANRSLCDVIAVLEKRETILT